MLLWYMYVYKSTGSTLRLHYIIHCTTSWLHYGLPHWICQRKHLRFFGMACFLYIVKKIHSEWLSIVLCLENNIMTYQESLLPTCTQPVHEFLWLSTCPIQSEWAREKYYQSRRGTIISAPSSPWICIRSPGPPLPQHTHTHNTLKNCSDTGSNIPALNILTIVI